ncbi:MAG: hypothetical protein JSR76_08370 [Verrucomicrobia bacterium]|nr:hypothetical protein [Verrucomicrobiota bacterium]
MTSPSTFIASEVQPAVLQAMTSFGCPLAGHKPVARRKLSEAYTPPAPAYVSQRGIAEFCQAHTLGRRMRFDRKGEERVCLIPPAKLARILEEIRRANHGKEPPLKISIEPGDDDFLISVLSKRAIAHLRDGTDFPTRAPPKRERHPMDPTSLPLPPSPTADRPASA